jgi:hypothetical protein
MKKVAIIGNGIIGKLAQLPDLTMDIEFTEANVEARKSHFEIESLPEIEYPDTYLSGKDKRRIRRAAERKAKKKKK